MLFHLFRSVPFNMQESSDGVNYSVSDQGRHFIWLLFHYCPRFLRKASCTILTSGPLPPCHGEGDAGERENAEKHAAFKCKSGVKGSGRDLLRQKSLRFGVAMAGRRPSSPETRCHALSRRGAGGVGHDTERDENREKSPIYIHL